VKVGSFSVHASVLKDLITELFLWYAFLVSAAIGNPIPEEVMVASAGVRAAAADQYGPYRWLILPACFAGAVTADVGLYFLGRLFGARLLRHRWLAWLAPEEKRERIRENFHNYGVIIFISGRLVPGIRTTLFLTAGMMRLSVVRFLIADGIGAALGNTLFFLLGYWLGSQFVDLINGIEKQLSVAKPLILLVILLAVAGYVLYLMWRRPIPTGDPEELPLIGHQVATHLPSKCDPPQAAAADPPKPEAQPSHARHPG
jgi:membrane protein DedA with SNARE-associated domain